MVSSHWPFGKRLSIKQHETQVHGIILTLNICVDMEVVSTIAPQ